MRDEIKVLITALIILVAVTEVTKFIYPTQNTMWNVYYERQVRETFYKGQIPSYDELSYLGRPMTYLPGYFGAKALFLWLMNMNYGPLGDYLFELFLNVSFVIGLWYLGRKLKLNGLSLLIFILIPASGIFVFQLLSAHLLHVLSLDLLIFSLVFYFGSYRYKEIITGTLLGASSIVHAFSLVMFPIIYGSIRLGMIKTKRELWSEMERGLVVILIALLILMLFYSPTLIKYGGPKEALPRLWGWLRHWTFNYIYTEYQFLFPLIILSSLFGLVKRKTRVISVFILIFVISYFTLSYRVNILISFLSAPLIAFLFEDKKSKFLILLLILINLTACIYYMGGFQTPPCADGYANPECLSVITELRNGVDPVAVPPLFGHATTFIVERPVLADLYVEYADQQKLKDEIELERTKNLSLAKKWNVTTMVVEGKCNRTIIYDNGFYSICLLDP